MHSQKPLTGMLAQSRVEQASSCGPVIPLYGVKGTSSNRDRIFTTDAGEVERALSSGKYASEAILAGPDPDVATALHVTEGASRVAASRAFADGLVELQDASSQAAVLRLPLRDGDRVLDLCAGGGGKTLALAALMSNKGQVYAADTDGRRLAGLYPRLEKSGAMP